MVQITHCGENCIKINEILKAAQKRFGLYGVEKTSMRELAADLNMSKASLYYYFPDKESLVKAVVEMEQDHFFEIVDEAQTKLSDPKDKLRNYNELRLSYFRSFFNLGRMNANEIHVIKPMLASTLANFRRNEENIIQKILNDGIKENGFVIENVAESASIFIEILKSLRVLSLQHKELLLIEDEEYVVLKKKLDQFVELFIRSLK